MFNPVMDIDRRIEDLQRVKENYQRMPQQPINIYNNTNPFQSEFKAQYLGDNEKVEDLLIQCKTCFISLKNKEIAIKDVNGDITRYEIVLPKDEKDLKIEELERKLKDYEQFTNANNEIKQSNSNVDGYDESTTKRISKPIPKQS